MKSAEVTEEELKVLKSLDRLGGGGTPIDIAVEGLMDLEKVRDNADKLSNKGILLSHRMPNPAEKRYFAFSEQGKEEYLKKLAELDD